MVTKLQIRHDTQENWWNENPVLARGEIGYETDTFMMKIGNGFNCWKKLDYIKTIYDDEEVKTDIKNLQKSVKLINSELEDMDISIAKLKGVLGETIKQIEVVSKAFDKFVVDTNKKFEEVDKQFDKVDHHFDDLHSVMKIMDDKIDLVGEIVKTKASSFHYDQPAKLQTWVVKHNLDKVPVSVTIVQITDAGEQIEIEGEVDYIDRNTVVLYFKEPIRGWAYLV